MASRRQRIAPPPTAEDEAQGDEAPTRYKVAVPISDLLPSGGIGTPLRILAAVEAVADALAIERPSIGEVTIGCALGYLDFRFADRPWRAAHPRAAAWFERFDSTPAMHATRPYE